MKGRSIDRRMIFDLVTAYPDETGSAQLRARDDLKKHHLLVGLIGLGGLRP
jgi:hypothetical protein